MEYIPIKLHDIGNLMKSYCIHKELSDAACCPPVQAMTIPLQPRRLRGKNAGKIHNKFTRFQNLNFTES